jgi:hypothetical protein
VRRRLIAACVTVVAIVMMAVVLVAFGPQPAPSPSSSLFRASFIGSAVKGGPDSYVSATVGEKIWVQVEITAGSEVLIEPQIDIDGPGAIGFRSCTAREGNEQTPGYANGPNAHVDDGSLEVGIKDRVRCEFLVERRISGQQMIDISLSATNQGSSESRQLYLVPSGGRSSREAAETLIEHELKTGPAAWSRSTFDLHHSVVIRAGREWPLLSPRSLHGFGSLPNGHKTTLAHLWSNRARPRGLIEFKAIISEPPVTVQAFRVGRSSRLSRREVFSIGETEKGKTAWCATTRSTSQPGLWVREQIKVQAVVLGFAFSRTSHGEAAMLDCPAVQGDGNASSNQGATEPFGATTAPDGSGQ